MVGGFILRFSDNFFKKVEKKTNVNKETILSLAERLQDENMKKILLMVVVAVMATKEKEDKIVKTIIDDKVPNNIEDYMK